MAIFTFDVVHLSETDAGWRFTVVVDGGQFSVDVDRDHWRGLTDGTTEPEELVKRSFAFLLEREPLSAVLKSFNLRTITQYFPEYETVIRGEA